MAKDLKLDFINGKLINDTVQGKDRIIQQIKIAVRILKGEWELDSNYGVSYLINPKNAGLIAQEVKEMIQQVVGVISVKSINVNPVYSSAGFGTFNISAIIQLDTDIIRLEERIA